MQWFPALLIMIPSGVGFLQGGFVLWNTIEKNASLLR